jgi:signal transduction histidine kinase
MPEGGTLGVSTALADNMLLIRISDTGVGIPDENKKRLFTPFFTTKKNGTGLGLAITYRIIENHRGRIDVESEPGKGTMFTVRIPVT